MSQYWVSQLNSQCNVSDRRGLDHSAFYHRLSSTKWQVDIMNKDTDPKHLRVRKGENLPHTPFLREVPIEVHVGSPCSWCCHPKGEISCAMAGRSPREETRQCRTPKCFHWGTQRWRTCLASQDVLFQLWACKVIHIDHTGITHGKWGLYASAVELN